MLYNTYRGIHYPSLPQLKIKMSYLHDDSEISLEKNVEYP
jgi:hypothetical protein